MKMKIGDLVLAHKKSHTNGMVYNYDDFIDSSPLGIGKIVDICSVKGSILYVLADPIKKRYRFTFLKGDLIPLDNNKE